MAPRPFTSAVRPTVDGTAGVRWFLVTDGGLVVRDGRDGTAVPGSDDETVRAVDPEDALYLGRLGKDDCWAAWVEEPVGDGARVAGLRTLWSVLDDDLFAVAGRAVQIVDWDRSHRFCGRCAAPTERDPDERVRRCPRCGLTAYPRLAPATITLVHRHDQVLLARGVGFASGVHSILAGFVEPGESLEECVAREVREEVGVEVDDITYVASQPWPFPHSLMVGFTARWVEGELRPDPTEIAEAAWYRVDELPPIPSGISISRRLIDDWVRRMRA
jgi:NAD+ diphosphatase